MFGSKYYIGKNNRHEVNPVTTIPNCENLRLQVCPCCGSREVTFDLCGISPDRYAIYCGETCGGTPIDGMESQQAAIDYWNNMIAADFPEEIEDDDY